MSIKSRLEKLEATPTKSGKLYTGFMMVIDEDEQTHHAQRLNDGYTMENIGNGFTAWKSPTSLML